MAIRKSPLLLILLAIASLGGCTENGECLSACEEQNAAQCGGLIKVCDELCSLRADRECEAEGAAADACLMEGDDICLTTMTMACQAEINALATCNVDFCEANPEDEDCPDN